jgi:hypothetical protein
VPGCKDHPLRSSLLLGKWEGNLQTCVTYRNTLEDTVLLHIGLQLQPIDLTQALDNHFSNCSTNMQCKQQLPNLLSPYSYIVNHIQEILHKMSPAAY